MPPKRSPKDIELRDVEDFIETQSDFLFELRVLDKLRDLSFTCEHSGTYEDPVSKKVREFDILATINERDLAICLSVECKNLKKSFPLVVHCTRRNEVEAYNDIVIVGGQTESTKFEPFSNTAKTCCLRGRSSIYQTGRIVGKSTDQIFRDDKGELHKNDSEVFEKISQAINSSYKLIQEVNKMNRPRKVFICPILVVQNGTLWSATYEPTESHDFHIAAAEHISYYIGKTWETSESVPSLRLTYTLSHLEIVTIGHLEKLVTNFLSFKEVFFS